MQANKTISWSDPDPETQELFRAADQANQKLFDYIAHSPTAWQAARKAAELLEEARFAAYDPRENWSLQPGDRGYVLQNGSALIAWQVGNRPLAHGLKIFGAHTDAPGLKIKPRPVLKKEEIVTLGVEVYGGPLLATWFDRPLSLAGRVCLKGAAALTVECRLVDFREPLFIIPNLAIHMGNKSNEGEQIHREKDIIPCLGMDGETMDEDCFKRLLAAKVACRPEDILDYDFFLYEVDPPCYCGYHKCFISAGRLDNQAMCLAGLSALTACRVSAGLQILVLTDNEEVGSRSKQGANGLWVRDTLERIILALGGDRQDVLRLLAQSFMISADQAHACHPNYPEVADPNHRPRINHGPVIKVAASQSYASDAYSSSVFRQLARQAGVPCQVFVNRSDLRGGSTIGPITSAILPIPTVDCGNAIWGMHSIRETGGSLDQYYMTQLVTTFYEAD